MFDGCEHDKNDGRCEVGMLVIEMRRKVFIQKHWHLTTIRASWHSMVRNNGSSGISVSQSVNGRLTTMLLSQAI